MGGGPQAGQERIQIYQVVDPQVLLSARDRLASMFAGRPEDSSVHVSVSRDGGRWWFVDDRVLWRTADSMRLPRSSLAAEAAARSFIGRVAQAVSTDRDLANSGIKGLFPYDIRLAFIALVIDPDRGVDDHWLVRFDAYLPTGTSFGSVFVYGAVVDVRVGQDGAVGSFWLAWRPCIPKGLAPLADLGAASSNSTSDGSGSPQPVLVYRLADEGSSQTFISPYYFASNGDDGDFFSASVFSPVAKIVDDPKSETSRVIAAVDGGSGNYAYRWMSWSLTNPMEGYSDRGTDDGVALTPGAYNVVLGVTDLQTGSVVVVQRSVFTDMFAADGASA